MGEIDGDGAVFCSPRTYRVQRPDREPLVRFMRDALEGQGCRILHCSEPDRAPFIITFETRDGERMGVVAYAFLATRTVTKNRPLDERSFQVKYGSKLAENVHDIWIDPLGVYTTIFLGIAPDGGYFVAVDPEMHNPTKFFIRVEYKDSHAEQILKDGWYAWERSKVGREDRPVEVLVGGTAEHFLDFIRFERAAQGLDPGNRHLLAQRPALFTTIPPSAHEVAVVEEIAGHPLTQELELSSADILDLIASARRLKMAVRGWVAERHLVDVLAKAPEITHCERLDVEGAPDLQVRLRDGPLLTVECKNVLREPDKHGTPRLDFQRTRASKNDPCSRYYAPSDFDVVAACLHAVTESWEFRYIRPSALSHHDKCPGKLSNNVRINEAWSDNPLPILEAASLARL